MDKYICECGKEVEREDATPVQGSGWYGNWKFEWENRYGVNLPYVTEIDCPSCGLRTAVVVEE